LKSFQRLKKGVNAQDDEILWIVSTHLKGAAAVWWEAVEDDITRWDDFVSQFKAKFASELMKRNGGPNWRPSDKAPTIVLLIS
jgi:hypothetical protein